MTETLIVGGSSGIGRVIAERAAARGEGVWITSRSTQRANDVAAEIGAGARGVALDLAEPASIEAALEPVKRLDHLVVTAIEQAALSLADFDLEQATRSLTVKLIGYAEVVRVLTTRFDQGGSVVLFGGLAKDRPYPGSTMVTTFNAGVSGLIRTMAIELAPLRVNALHPGVVGDSPKWREVPDHPHIARTPIGRLVTMDEIAVAAEFLLRNGGVNAHDLVVDGGLLTS